MTEDRSSLHRLSPADTAMVETAMRRGASRRDLLAMLTGGGLALAAAGSVLGSATRALAQAPKRGGRIRVAGTTTSTSDTLDPAKQSNATDYSRCNMFYDGLFDLDASLAPQPSLAEGVRNDGAKVWTFTLRKDITFHDGSSLTADDVVYSLARHKDPAIGSKAKSLADPMTDIKATGPGEVQVTLSSPNADLPVVLGTFHFKIIKAGTTDFATANGTGPFRCKEFTPGVRSIAVRNPNYWKPGQPYLDEIEYVGIPDEQARVNALLSGDVDLTSSIDPRSVRRIERAEGYGIFETKSGYYTDLVVRLDETPGNNPDFVMAMKLLCDREQMRSAILRGHAVVGNDQPIDPSNRFYFAGLPQRPFDLDRAKFHFQKSGVGTAAVPIYCAPAAEHSVDMSLLMQQTAQKIGLTLDVKQVPNDGYWSNHWMKHPVGFGAVNPRPSADILFTLFFQSQAAWNESAWKDPKFDQLLLAARTETDEAKRKAMYADMQTLVHENSGIGVPLFLNLIDAHTSKLKGLTPVPLGSLMGYGFADKIWLDA